MDLSFIFLGSTHSFLDDFSIQKEVIDNICPEFVLSEELEDLNLEQENQFKEILNKRFISYMTDFNEVERLIKLCFERKIKLIGIDFHNFGLDDFLQEKIKNQKELTKKEQKVLNQLVKKREKYHLSKILEYKLKTKKPLVVIIGCWHLRKNSLLRRRLKNYKIIAPIDEYGEVLLEPNTKNIKYGEIFSNEQKTEN